ncbi:MAG TPA: acyl-CoA dehydrogenase family protein [Candidatus Dormibacteraeota bacterium]|nr:acyl-CoA dehydrogenase family protein [Candidatus Dormibacteraeota bacterium]
MNQSPPLQGGNLFTGDRVLVESLAAFAPAMPREELELIGALAGDPETIALGFDANAYPPELHTHDANGNRIDEVRFHPSWHRLLAYATSFGLSAAAWHDVQPLAHLRRAAAFYVWSQVESGHGCPISMSYAAVATLRVQPDLASVWEPRLSQRGYEPALLPVEHKRAALCGMGMTEKQGGSDVRANTTRAVAESVGGPGRPYRLTGHKWFCSAPMSDGFLVLAQAPGGLSCFLVPRVLADGRRNTFLIQRLKEKLGNRSNASAEVEFERTQGHLVGEEGRGLAAIVEMVNYTRLDCMLGSAALVRQALAQALHHARYRRAFGKPLLEHPLMRNVLADIALESEAATWLCMRLARAVDDGDAELRRIGTAVGKYWICKRTPVLVGEALECLGGNGYVESSILPRLYREAPLNSIWEGAGNINALDVVRILRKQPAAFEALHAQWAAAREEPRVAGAVRAFEASLRDEEARESQARTIAEQAALIWQASLLLAHAPHDVADAFVRSRLCSEGGRALGTLPPECRLGAILDRAAPQPAEVVA